MKEPSVNVLKKYLSAMEKMKGKYITAEKLSRVIGIYPEVISETLSYFDPTLRMDYTYNLLELVPQMKEYIILKTEKKEPVVKVTHVKKKEVELYDSIGDFIYKKMTIGGLLDKNTTLSNSDLRIMRKLINLELAKRNKR